MLSCFSCVWLFVTPSTPCDPIACQAPLSMGFSRQEYSIGLPCPPSGDLPDQGSNLCLLQFLPRRRILYRWTTREPLNLIFFSVWMTRKSHWFQRKYHFPLKGHMSWHSASHRTINRTDRSWLTLWVHTVWFMSSLSFRLQLEEF